MTKQAIDLPMADTVQSQPSAELAHYPVMRKEVLEFLSPKAGEKILDCTIGGAGHASALLTEIGPEGFLWGIERDPRTLELATRRLSAVGYPFELIHGNFAELSHWADAYSIPPLDGILMDLGTSIFQLKEAERGFSLLSDGPLDMRMNPQENTPSAADLVNTLGVNELKSLFKEFGEERFAGRIARWIVELRTSVPFTRTRQLADLVAKHIPQRDKIHPATRIFQALRIAVNQEYKALEDVLPAAVQLLKPGGKIAVISFHSGEDRRVKQAFREMSQTCVCPPRQPICNCNTQPLLERPRKMQVPGKSEVQENPPSRSAKLRTAYRIEHLITG
jgi:16S rRNA (cytosine1402-N4)-methyltransferase